MKIMSQKNGSDSVNNESAGVYYSVYYIPSSDGFNEEKNHRG